MHVCVKLECNYYCMPLLTGRREIRINWYAYWYWSKCVLHCGWCGI